MAQRRSRAGFTELALFLTWELPQSLLGLLVFAVCAGTGAVQAIGWCYGRVCVRTRAVGVSLGAFVFWFTGPKTERSGVLRHELGHCRQSRCLGPLYLAAVGLPSLLRACYARWYYVRYGGAWSGYRAGYPERWADRVAPPPGALGNIPE